MSFKVRRSLQQAAAEASSDRLEAAGFLFGRLEPDIFGIGTRLEVLDFSFSRRLAEKREAGSMRWSSSHLADAFRGKASRWPLIGDAHTHVRGNLEPSELDYGSWGGKADRVSWAAGRAPGYLGLIIGAEPGAEWLAWNMKLRAWFVPPLRWDVKQADREPRRITIREEV